MNCFMLKAISTDHKWIEFSISDIPTPISDSQFVLLKRPNSPILNIEGIRRGDPETGLFEGDIIERGSVLYLICYERGFYAINGDYVVCLFNELGDYTVVGDTSSMEIDIPISYKKTLLFKYKNTIFKINDIVGSSKGGILINSIAEVIKPELVRQDCCFLYKKQRMYLGDTIEGFPLQLVGGQLKIRTSTGEFKNIEEIV